MEKLKYTKCEDGCMYCCDEFHTHPKPHPSQKKLTKQQIEVIESLQKGSELKYYQAGCIANSAFQLIHKNGSYDKVNGKIGYALLQSNLLKEVNREVYTQYRANIYFKLI